MGRRIGIAAILVVLVAIGAYLSQRGTVDEAAAVSPKPSPSAKPQKPRVRPTAQRATISGAEGVVEWRTPTGEWEKLEIGQQLNTDDVIRTQDGSTAQLLLGKAVTVNVAERTSFTIGTISEQVSQAVLEDGRIASVVRKGKGVRFKVNVRGTDTVAETGEGEFDMMKRGKDSDVVVAATTGKVDVTAQDKKVEVAAGQISIVEKGKAPSDPEAIPASLFLKLGKPPASRQRKPETTISGSTLPGAIVSVNGVLMSAGRTGQFQGKIPLDEGVNEVTIEVEDVKGRSKSVKLPKITVDSKAPGVRGEVEW